MKKNSLILINVIIINIFKYVLSKPDLFLYIDPEISDPSKFIFENIDSALKHTNNLNNNIVLFKTNFTIYKIIDIQNIDIEIRAQDNGIFIILEIDYFKITTSKLIISNFLIYSILKSPQPDFFFEIKENSSLIFNNCNFTDFKLSNTKIFQTFIYLHDSSLIIDSCFFNNIEIYHNSLIFAEAKEKNYEIIINFSKFENILQEINQNYIKETKSLIQINNFLLLNILNSSFSNSIIDNDILFVENIKIVNISNTIYFNNIISTHNLNIINSDTIYINGLSCIENNKRNIRINDVIIKKTNSGGCFRFKNVINRFLENIIILNSYSDKTTIGMKIIDIENKINIKKIESTNIIKNSIFENNFVYCNGFDDETAVSLYIMSDNYLEIINCTFSKNIILSNLKSKFLGFGPCLISFSSIQTIFITLSNFLDNQSSYLSNCILFNGLNLTLTKIKSYNNTDYYYFIDPIQLKPGGFLTFRGSILYTNDSLFQKNNGYRGGCILIDSITLQKQEILIENTIFKDNFAGMGPTIAFSKYSKSLYALIIKNYFEEGLAGMGGALSLNFQSKDCLVDIKNNTFIKNFADFAGCLDFDYLQGFVKTSYNLFVNNFGKSFFNSSIGSGSVISLRGQSESILYCDGDQFLGNFGEAKENFGYSGGTLYSLQYSIAFLINCTFDSQFSVLNGGSIVVKDHSYYKIENSIFKDCSSQERAGTIYISEESNLQMYNTIIQNSFANYGGILYTIENYNTSINIINSVFINCNSISSLFDSLASKIEINNSTFNLNKNSIFMIKYSSLIVLELKITNHICNIKMQGCILYSELDSKTNFTKINISNVLSYNEGGTVYVFYSKIEINDIIMFNISNSKKIGCCITSLYSELTIRQSNFKKYDYSCIYSENNKEINIFTTLFQDNHNNLITGIIKYGAFFCKNCLSINIHNSSFIKNIDVEYGSAIFLFDDYNENLVFESSLKQIIKCIFLDNNAIKDGGSIYIKNQYIIINSSKFSNNHALNGGSIFLNNHEDFKYSIHIQNTQFFNNSAEMDGGGIKWIGNKPEIADSNIFLNNKAIYGMNIASFPLRMSLEIISIENSTIFYSSESNLSEGILKNITAGTIIPYFLRFKILDYYNQIVYSANGNIGIKSNNELQIRGTNPVTIEKGEGIFKSLIFSHEPSNKINLYASSTSIDKYYKKYLKNSAYEFNINNTYQILFNIEIRRCLPGEIYRSDYKICQQCQTGGYSLIDGMISKECVKCPENSVGCWSNIILVKNGYWRDNINSIIIYDCVDYALSCLGGYRSECSFGFEGPLCGVCSIGYSKFGRNLCVECSNENMNLLSLIGIFLLILIFLGIFLIVSVKQSDQLLQKYNSSISNSSKQKTGSKKSSRNNFFDMKKGASIYLKILLNYLQMIAIVQNMELKWPFYVKDYLNVYSNVGGSVSSNILSFDCFLQDFDIDTEPIYIQTALTTSIPFIMIFLSLIVLVFIYLKSKKSQNIRIIVIIVVVSIFMQPSIIKSLFDNMVCKKIYSNNYLASDFRIQCDETNQKKWLLKIRIYFYIYRLYSFIYPMLLLWMVFYPGLCLFYLIKNKKKLDDVDVRAKMGFYINGYKEELFYWEFFIMYRKIIFISLNLFENMPLITKVSILLCLASLSTYITFFAKPFILKEMNMLEFYSNLAALITIYSGSLYIGEVSDFIKAISFTVIIFINFIFSAIWLSSLIKIVFHGYFNLLYKYFPKFTIWISCLIEAIDEVSFSNGILQYLKEVRNVQKKNYVKYNNEKDKQLFDALQSKNIASSFVKNSTKRNLRNNFFVVETKQ